MNQLSCLKTHKEKITHANALYAHTHTQEHIPSSLHCMCTFQNRYRKTVIQMYDLTGDIEGIIIYNKCK